MLYSSDDATTDQNNGIIRGLNPPKIHIGYYCCFQPNFPELFSGKVA